MQRTRTKLFRNQGMSVSGRTLFTTVTSCAVLALMSGGMAFGQDLSGTQDDEAVDIGRTGGIERMVVTAQRTEEDLLDVPIAITAIDSEALDSLQVDNFSDLQFNVPNVSFTKTNFSGSNFQIRGIGTSVTSASADSGVAVHINDVYFNTPRLFETEYFDVERVEVLRGPQGTLYGRNATGGAINLITKKPVHNEFSAYGEFEYTNFNGIRVNGHLNVPIVDDKVSLRIAGIFLNRDGFTETINPNANFDDFDGRNQYSVRGTLRLEPTERTRIDIMASYYREDDNRSRSPKSLCDFDPSAILGCAPTGLGFNTPNFSATLGGINSSSLFLGPFGLFPFGADIGIPNPPDLRQSFSDFEPQFESDELFVTVDVQHQINDWLTLTVLGSYQETTFDQFEGNSVTLGGLNVPPAVFATLPMNAAFFFGDGLIPTSNFDLENFAGSINGDDLFRSSTLAAFDQSTADDNQFSFEARVASSLDGPLNFLVAAYYLNFESTTTFNTVSNSLDYFSAVFPAILATGQGLPPNVFDGQALATTFVVSETDPFELDSYAVFGELYWDIRPDLKATFGARYTVDEKSVRDRATPPFNSGLVPIGEASIPALDAALRDFREISETFSAVTGRFVLDWTPELDFTDSTLVYVSYQRGFKSGGINPPLDPLLTGIVGPTFEPEFINAFEVGTKNVLLDNKLQLGLTGFFYDYSGLQVGRLVERTIFNENIDATIAGLELETLFAPTDNLLFNVTASYLRSRIADGVTSVDSRDLTNGRTDVTLIKDLTAAQNCLIEHNGAPPPETLPNLQTPNGGFLVPAGVPIPGIEAGGAFSSVGCGSNLDGVLAGLNAAGLPYTQLDGEPVDISGNELSNSPNWSFNIGAQYSRPIYQDITVVGRVDYYRQGESFGRLFNGPADVIGEWGQLNFRVSIEGPEQKWFVAGFVQNALDDDNITGHALSGPGGGLATGVFVLDPRLYGVNLGYRF